MKKSKVIILSVLLFAMLALTSKLIAAWLTDTKSTSSTTFTVGDVKFSWNGATISADAPIVRAELDRKQVLSCNASTVDAELRVEIIAAYTLAGSNDEVSARALQGLSLMDGWELNSEDGKWYYDATITPDDEAIDVIDTWFWTD